MNKLLKIGASALSAVVVGLSALPSVSAAETGQNVLDDTRYSAVGIGEVDILIGILADIANEVIPDTRIEDIADSALNLFAEKAAELATNSLNGKSFGIHPNFTPITIEDSFIVMGKRKVMYPNDEYEIDTCYVYINKNDTLATPQQFGSVSVARVSFLLI